MSDYQVLARKYRPKQFSEVVGQDHIIRTLENAITKKRIAHAYLFVGPRGTGKTTIARIFAKTLNCSKSKEPTAKPCGECSNCLEIQAGNSLDVLEIDGASNNGVDQVRELRETVRYAPTNARYRVIYIDEVHMLSISAFNALLKTLEEPPPHAKFLLATTDPQKIPLTIISRCQRFDLKRIPNDLIIKHLRKICGWEKVTITDAALLAIARGASGGLRDAESALDQVIAFCGNEIREEDILSIFGLASRDQMVGLAEAILNQDRAAALRLVSTLAEEGKDLTKLLGELLEHFRNLLVIQAGVDWTEGTEEERTIVQKHAGRLPRLQTLRILEILTEAENQIRWSLSKKIFFEVTLLKAIESCDEILLEDILKRLKEGGTSGTSQTVSDERRKSDSPRPVSEEESGKPKTVPSSNLVNAATGPSMETLWKQLLTDLEKTKPMLC